MKGVLIIFLFNLSKYLREFLHNDPNLSLLDYTGCIKIFDTMSVKKFKIVYLIKYLSFGNKFFLIMTSNIKIPGEFIRLKI